MDLLTPHLPKILKEHRHLTAFGKCAVLLNLFVILLLALFSQEGLVYKLLRHSSHWDEGLLTVMFMFCAYLFMDLCKYDMSAFGRRHWKGERAVPIMYMLTGFGYLAMAFVGSTALLSSSWPLLLGYIGNAALCGWMAFITKMRLSWSTHEAP